MATVRLYQTYLETPESIASQTVTGTSIVTQESVGQPDIISQQPGEQLLLPVAIGSAEQISGPTIVVVGEDQTVTPTSIGTATSFASPFIVAKAPYLGYRVVFTPTDTYSVNPEELTYTVRTASGGSGTLLYSGTATSGVQEVSDIIDDPGLVVGQNTRYIRLVDGGGNIVDSSEIIIILDPPESYVSTSSILSEETFGEDTELFSGRARPASIESEETFGTLILERGFVPEQEPFSIHRYFAGMYGPVQYEIGLRYYDTNGILVGDLKDSLVQMSLDWDMSRTVQRSMSCTLSGPMSFLSHTYILEPYVIAQVYNPNLNSTTEQEFLFAQYIQTNPRQSIGTSSTRSITGYDFTNRLVEKTIEDQLTIGQGDNYGSRIRYLAIEAGFQDRRISLPVTTATLPVPLTFEPGTSYYDIITMLADAVNWSKPFMTNNNTLRIIERKDMTTREKTRTFATDNTSSILPNVQHELDIRKIVNKVIININDPLRTPETITYINDNLDNPYSRSRSGKTITEIIENLNHLASTEIAQERAKLEVQLLNSNAEMELKTIPNFTLAPHEIYSVVITDQATGEPLIFSDWYAQSWTMTMDVGAETTIQLKNIMPV